MNPLKRIEGMAEYGFHDLELEESMNMHEDALELMKEIQAIEAENKKLHDLFEHINGDEYGYQIYDRYKESIKESE